MSGENFQDNVVYGTDGVLRVSSVIAISNTGGVLALVANPSANQTLSFPDSGGTIVLSGQAVQALGISTGGNTAGNTGTTQGTYVLAGGNNITLSQSTAAGSLATLTISAANSATVVSGIGVSTGGNTAGNTGTTVGTVVFAGAGEITLSQSTAAGSLATISISAPQAIYGAGISTGGNTSGTSGTVTGTLVLAGGNNVTVSQSTNASGATITISAGTAAGTGVAAIGASTGGNTSGNTGTTQGTFVLAGGNNITLSQSTAAGSLATLTISAPNMFAGGVSTGGNTAGSTGTVSSQIVFAGGNNVTLSQSTGGASNATITISAANSGTVVSGIGVSTGGNTAGSTGTTVGTVVFAGGNRITLSQSTAAGSLATITISGPNDVQGLGISNVGNTSGTSGTQTGTIVFAGGNLITLSQSTGGAGVHTITISAAAPTLQSFTFPDQPAGSFATSDAGFSVMPFAVPFNISATKLMFLAQLTAATNSTGSVTFSAGLYTMSGSTASLASSTSRAFSWSSGTTNSTASTVYGGLSGTRYRTMALGTWNITPGNYLFGFYGRSSNAGTWSLYGQTQTVSLVVPTDTNETNFFLPGFSTSSFTTAMPASINVTDTNYVRTGASAYRQIGFLFQAS